MRFSAKAVLAALLLAAPAFAASPRLTVVVVVDQMRADYLQRFTSPTGGFARLMKDGAVFTNARHAHVPTETSPGHAALLTGCFPFQHGIVGNTWWDRKTGKDMYSVEDPERWRSPANLTCPTLGDALKTASPKSKLVSVSGKDRAAILMGGHKPDLVLWYDKTPGQWVTSGYYGRMPDWVWNWDAKLKIPADQKEELVSTPRFDSLVLELARRAIEEQGLGQDEAPDLLTVSLSATDYTGHKYGPDSPQMGAQLAALDREIGAFLDYLDGRLGRGAYIVALSSDHGVAPIPETPAGKKLGAKRVMDDEFEGAVEAALRASLGAPSQAGKKWLVGVYSPHVYLNFPMAKEMGIDPARLKTEASRALERQSAVARVYAPEELAGGKASGPFAAEFARAVYPDRSGDLFILLKKGVVLIDNKTGTGHSLPYEYDSNIPMILMGPGVKPGRYSGEALATDLAPTLARILEVEFQPKTPSRVLDEALFKIIPSAKEAAPLRQR